MKKRLNITVKEDLIQNEKISRYAGDKYFQHSRGAF